jgi:hypothetical protein
MKKMISLSLIGFLLGSAMYCPLQASSKGAHCAELSEEKPNPVLRKIMKKIKNWPSKKRRKALQSAIDKEKAKIKRSALVSRAQHLLLQPRESLPAAATASFATTLSIPIPSFQPPTSIGSNTAGAAPNHAAVATNVPNRKLRPSTKSVGEARPFYGTLGSSKSPLVSPNRGSSTDEKQLKYHYGRTSAAGTWAPAGTSDTTLGAQKRLALFPSPSALTVSPGGSLTNPIVFVSSSRPGSLHSPLRSMTPGDPSPLVSPTVPSLSTVLVSYAPTPDQHLWLATKKELDELYGSDFHVHDGLKSLVVRLTGLTQRHVKAPDKLEDGKSVGKTEPCAVSGSAAAVAFPSGAVPAAAAAAASPSPSSRDKVLVIDLYPEERSNLIMEAMVHLAKIRERIPSSLGQSSLVGSLDRLETQLRAPAWYAEVQERLLDCLGEILNAPLLTQGTQIEVATQIPRDVLLIIMRYLKSPITLPSAESFQQQIRPKLSQQADRSWKCEHPDENVITNPAGFGWVPHLFLRYSAATPPLESEPLPPRPRFTLLYNPERSDSMWTPSNKLFRVKFCLAQFIIVEGDYLLPWNEHSLFATLRLQGLENRGELGLKFKKIFMGYVSGRHTEP